MNIGAVIRPVPGEWTRACPSLGEAELQRRSGI